MRRALDRLSRAAARFGIWFAPSKHKVLLQEWTAVVPNFIMDGEELTITDRLTYLTTCVSKHGRTAVEESMWISKAGAAYAEL